MLEAALCLNPPFGSNLAEFFTAIGTSNEPTRSSVNSEGNSGCTRFGQRAIYASAG